MILGAHVSPSEQKAMDWRRSRQPTHRQAQTLKAFTGLGTMLYIRSLPIVRIGFVVEVKHLQYRS